MSSLAKTSIDVPFSPVAASEALVPVLTENGYELAEDAVPGSAELAFLTRRTMFKSATWGLATITANGSGSSIELGIDVAQNERKTLLDGRRNRRALDDLAAQVTAALGSA